ncbi:BTAD domain-containing putative transcriptional regulator [Actinokineospora fastidiosa]|uniref:SARP family transcriptional regulator n=1 Tax=Actinokineospora fastidiosa TaxID=1816 RepID=A0A918LBW5_9PSEU|nr:BTAD domain-containing putative transcriptional regulator [Actinokineospora fastidiosa]GGS29218.1 SARP family transcriptional regulator [Actinokineospora fastidiosa]
MDFRVLGPLEVWTERGRLALPSARHQRVLAALLSAPNSVVPITKLIEATWDDEPPATATKQIQNCISALRERLGCTGLIRTDGPGYRIFVHEDQLDALRFTRLVAEARRTAAEGDLAEGARAIRSALSLWRGPALDGIGSVMVAGRAARWDEQRLDAIELCADWRLALGEYREVADELAEVVAEHPLRERPHAQLMVALDRAGRQVDALAVFQRLRTNLAEELGIDPGAEVRALHERILRGEPRVENPGDHETAASDPRDDLAPAARELAAAIARQWRAEAEMRCLNRPEPVPLTWSSTERQVAAVASAVLGERRAGRRDRLVLNGDLADVVAKFRQVPSRQLVVLGDPGAGKTVLAILLTLGLLADPPPDEPVPVLLSLASWNPRQEHLHGWLARRLVEEYPGLANTAAYGKDAALRLVLEGRVIPVLDGLDETPPALHAAAIEALDQAVAGGRPLVVTCRSAEYELAVNQAGSFLARAAVVEIEPVELENAIGFLTARQRLGDDRWRPVVQRLRAEPDGVLAQALRTPLMVDLARTAYAHPATEPGELCDTARFPDRAAVEGHLLDAYLPAVYTRNPPPPAPTDRRRAVRDYDLDHAERWLGFLARHLERGRTRDLAWWQLDRAVPRVVVGLYLGLPPALLFLSTGWLVAGLWIGVIYGGAFAAAGCVTHSAGRRPGPVRVQGRFRGTGASFARRSAVGVVIGISFGVGWSLSAWVVGLLMVVFGLAVGVHVWLGTPLDANRVSSPATVLSNDRTATLSFTVSFMVAVGLFYGLAIVQAPAIGTFVPGFDYKLALGGGVASALLGRYILRSPGTWAYGLAGAVVSGQTVPGGTPTAALATGTIFGLGVGLTVCVARAWGTFAFTRLWLAAHGHIPLDFMTFLDDAHRRGVLRQVGAVYQFRHARLQERLAARGCGQRLHCPDVL